MSTWPPALTDFRRELRRTVDDTADQQLEQSALDAAIAFVERIHAAKYAFGDQFSDLPEVDANMWLGTLYLARRLNSRRRSPDGVIDLGELGTTRIPSFDPDIDRMLRIGRYKSPVFG